MLAAVEIIILLCIGGYRYALHMANLIQPGSFEQMPNVYLDSDKKEEMEGYWTIALFGVDSRDNSVGKGNNADVIIICNIERKTGEIKLVSVFRDSYLNISESGTYNKINQAYFLGGPKQAVEALNRNLDLQIDDFATFNWKAVVDAVNILGGVDVELSKQEFYYINAFITETVEATGVASRQLKQAGPNHLDGVQAVAYARLRKMDTDFARTERQRKIISLCFQKLKEADFSVVNNVMEVVFPQILTSVTLNDIIPAAGSLTRYSIADTMGFPESRSDVIMGKKGDCVIPQTLESNVARLHQFLFGDEDYRPSEMVGRISTKIAEDTGLYQEKKPIEHMGTDGGSIPGPKESDKAADKESAEEGTRGDGASAADGPDNAIKPDSVFQTDEDGNILDPPEEDLPSFYPGESSMPGTVPSGGVSSGGVNQPGMNEPGVNQPGVNQLGAHNQPGVNQPGADNQPGGTSPTVLDAMNQEPSSEAIHPGRTDSGAESEDAGTGKAGNPHGGPDGYVPEGPGSITGPGD